MDERKEKLQELLMYRRYTVRRKCQVISHCNRLACKNSGSRLHSERTIDQYDKASGSTST